MRPPSLFPEARSGREELKAALLRPPLHHFTLARGESERAQLLEESGIRESELSHDTAWIPLSCAKRVLVGIITQLGEEAVRVQGDALQTPEVLGIHVRLLRHAKTPRDAIDHFTRTASEWTRVGTFEQAELDEGRARIVYRPSPDIDTDQSDLCFCLLRQGQLSALPELFGLPPARIEHPSCLERGDPTCVYELSWESLDSRLGLGTAVAGMIGATTGAFLLATPTIAIGAGVLGGAAGLLLGQTIVLRRRDRATRTLERHRIVALEHGLEQRGQLRSQAGDLTGSLLGGKYQILRTVGTGGIGTVYAAEHLGLGFQVAVKVLRGAAAVDASEVARLRREARIQMSLEHPNIVRTFDLDQTPDGSLYVVMELLRGKSLQDHLKKKRPLAPGFAIPIFIQACRALSAAHRLQIVHRDLKPGNVFLCEGGNVKVLDFGMSKLAQEETLTQEGYTLGTPEYMSPEQCVGGPVDERSDLYAFGVLMYEALTGDLPFYGKNRQNLLEHHQRSTPKSMRQLRPDLNLPEELDRLVLGCLMKDPAERPASAQQLERALASVPPNSVVHDYPPDVAPRARDRSASSRPGPLWRPR